VIAPDDLARDAVELTISDVDAALKLAGKNLQKRVSAYGLQRPRQTKNFSELLVGEAERHGRFLLRSGTNRAMKSASLLLITLGGLGPFSDGGLFFLASLLALGGPFLDQRVRNVGPPHMRFESLLAAEKFSRTCAVSETSSTGVVEFASPKRHQLGPLSFGQ
jgi:hypothetical protein